MNSPAKISKSLRDSFANCGTALRFLGFTSLGALLVAMRSMSPDCFAAPARDARLSPLPNSVSPARVGSETSRDQPVVDQVHARPDQEHRT